MGIDLPRDIGTPRLSWQRLRRIIEHLGEDSATARARRDGRPNLTVQFLRRIDLATRLNAWMQSEEGSKGRNQPQLVPLHGDPKQGSGKRDSLEVTELLARRQAKRQAELATMGGH